MSTDPREFEHPIDGSDTPTHEAIEAAAKSMAEFNHWDWVELTDKYQASWLKCAEDMLSAAAPFIAAQAKVEALREAADAVEAIDPAWDSALYVDGAYHPVPDWLRARAATIEGKSE